MNLHGATAERDGEYYEQRQIFGEVWIVRDSQWHRTSSALGFEFLAPGLLVNL
jgi:hypothetical protein